MGKAVRSEFGQDFSEEFLPDREAKEMEHMLKMESTITLSQRPDDLLRHNTEYNGLLYKYDLPTQNLPIVFRNKNSLVTQEDEQLTATESLLDALECDRDTAFESFVIKLQQTYNNEVDMYGDIRRAGDS